MLRSIAFVSARALSNAAKRGILGTAKPYQASSVMFTHHDHGAESDDECHAHWYNRLPRPQDKAPGFKGQAVVNKQFKEIKLEDYKGKWLLLFFYPLDFTFVCPTEITAYSDRAEDFKKMDCEVVACSTDSRFSHLAWINTPRKQGGLGDMKIPVLADNNHHISSAYGVLLEELGAALRGTFLIDPKGIVRHVNVNDLSVGRSVDESLRLLKAFQYVDEHGEVCPANWQPNSPTINPKEAKKYFEKAN